MSGQFLESTMSSDGLEPEHGGVAPVNPLVQVHNLLRGRYWIALILLVVGAMVGAVAGYKVQPPEYTSTGLIRIKPNLPRILYASDQNGIMPMFDAFVGSQISLIQSRRVIDFAMQQPDWKQLNRGLAPEEVQEFTENLAAVNPRGSELVMVTLTDRDPEAARRGVKSVIDAYKQLYVNEGDGAEGMRRRILEDRSAMLTAELKKANEEIQRIADTVPAGSMNQLYEAKLQQSLRLESQVQEVAMALATAGAFEATTRPAAAPKFLSVEALAMRVPELSHLVSAKRELERTIDVERARRGDQHRIVIDAQAQLAALVKQIDELAETYRGLVDATPQIASGMGTGKSAERLRADLSNLKQLHKTAKDAADLLGSDCVKIEQLRLQADATKEKLDETNQRLDQLNTEDRVGGRITIENPGDTPLTPSKDKRKVFAAAGGLGLGGAGVGFVLLFGFLDRRIRHISDVKATAHASRILGVLPMLPDEQSDPEQAMVAAHSVHQIRTLLQRQTQDRSSSVIAVTSASAGAGKTSLTLALGLSYAASGARTLIIDCDIIGGGLTAKMKKVTRRRIGHVLRRLGLITSEQLVAAVRESRKQGERVGKTLTRHGLVSAADVDAALDVQKHSLVGLREALNGDPVNECITGGGSPNLYVMPLGSAQRQHVAQLSLASLQRLVNQVRGWFDVVLIDTGPILGSLEAAVAAMTADEVVLVVARGEQCPSVDRSIDHLNSVGGRLAGIVLNRASAADILTSEFSSSSRSVPGNSNQQAGLTLVAREHVGLQLGPIGRAVDALSSVEPTPVSSTSDQR